MAGSARAAAALIAAGAAGHLALQIERGRDSHLLLQPFSVSRTPHDLLLWVSNAAHVKSTHPLIAPVRHALVRQLLKHSEVQEQLNGEQIKAIPLQHLTASVSVLALGWGLHRWPRHPRLSLAAASTELKAITSDSFSAALFPRATHVKDHRLPWHASAHGLCCSALKHAHVAMTAAGSGALDTAVAAVRAAVVARATLDSWHGDRTALSHVTLRRLGAGSQRRSLRASTAAPSALHCMLAALEEAQAAQSDCLAALASAWDTMVTPSWQERPQLGDVVTVALTFWASGRLACDAFQAAQAALPHSRRAQDKYATFLKLAIGDASQSGVSSGRGSAGSAQQGVVRSAASLSPAAFTVGAPAPEHMTARPYFIVCSALPAQGFRMQRVSAATAQALGRHQSDMRGQGVETLFPAPLDQAFAAALTRTICGVMVRKGASEERWAGLQLDTPTMWLVKAGKTGLVNPAIVTVSETFTSAHTASLDDIALPQFLLRLDFPHAPFGIVQLGGASKKPLAQRPVLRANSPAIQAMPDGDSVAGKLVGDGVSTESNYMLLEEVLYVAAGPAGGTEGAVCPGFIAGDQELQCSAWVRKTEFSAADLAGAKLELSLVTFSLPLAETSDVKESPSAGPTQPASSPHKVQQTTKKGFLHGTTLDGVLLLQNAFRGDVDTTSRSANERDRTIQGMIGMAITICCLCATACLIAAIVTQTSMEGFRTLTAATTGALRRQLLSKWLYGEGLQATTALRFNISIETINLTLSDVDWIHARLQAVGASLRADDVQVMDFVTSVARMNGSLAPAPLEKYARYAFNASEPWESALRVEPAVLPEWQQWVPLPAQSGNLLATPTTAMTQLLVSAAELAHSAAHANETLLASAQGLRATLRSYMLPTLAAASASWVHLQNAWAMEGLSASFGLGGIAVLVMASIVFIGGGLGLRRLLFVHWDNVRGALRAVHLMRVSECQEVAARTQWAFQECADPGSSQAAPTSPAPQLEQPTTIDDSRELEATESGAVEKLKSWGDQCSGGLFCRIAQVLCCALVPVYLTFLFLIVGGELVRGRAVSLAKQDTVRLLHLAHASDAFILQRDAVLDALELGDLAALDRIQPTQTQALIEMQAVVSGTQSPAFGSALEALPVESLSLKRLTQDGCVGHAARWQQSCDTAFNGVAADGGLLQVLLRYNSLISQVAADIASHAASGGARHDLPAAARARIQAVFKLEQQLARDAEEAAADAIRQSREHSLARSAQTVLFLLLFTVLISVFATAFSVHSIRVMSSSLSASRAMLLAVPPHILENNKRFRASYESVMAEQALLTV